MAELLASKLVIEEEAPSIRSFPALASAVAGFEGVATMGPIADPQLVTSYAEYEKVFGSFINGRQLALAVRAFFLNGGQQAYINRIVHYTNYLNPATKTSAKGSVTLQTAGSAATSAEVTGSTVETFDLEPADTLIGDVEGVGNQTATFNAVAGAEECANAETYAISDGDTLLIKINGESTAQTITLSGLTGGAATAEEVAQSINAQIYGAKAIVSTAGTKVTLQSDRRGSSSSVQVTGGTANAALGFDGSVHDGSASSNVSNIDAVTVAEVKTIVEAAWTNGSGVTVTNDSGSVKISTVATGAVTLAIGAGTANTIIGLTVGTYNGSTAAPEDTLKMEGLWDGTYANSLQIKIANATSGEASEFNLQILNGSSVIEEFPNLTMDSTADRYATLILNSSTYGSAYFTGTDMGATGSVTARRPANTSGAVVTGGDDGLTSLDSNDFVGDSDAKTGFYAFDLIEDITLLACPDNVSTAVQSALINYCEVTRENLVFGVLDCQANATAETIIAQKTALGNHEPAAIYWPRLKVINPSKPIFGSTAETVTIVPSGFVMGIMATLDRTTSEGPFYQPAGTDDAQPYSAVDLEVQEVRLEAKRNLVFPKRINPINYMKGIGIFVDGARTMKGDGNFPSIGERRGVSHIERLLKYGLQWVRHKNNTKSLRRMVNKDVTALLVEWMNRGAFASTDPETAFFIDTSDALNPPSVIRAGKLVMRIGLATNSPAEFIIIKVTKDTRALEEELFTR